MLQLRIWDQPDHHGIAQRPIRTDGHSPAPGLLPGAAFVFPDNFIEASTVQDSAAIALARACTAPEDLRGDALPADIPARNAARMNHLILVPPDPDDPTGIVNAADAARGPSTTAQVPFHAEPVIRRL